MCPMVRLDANGVAEPIDWNGNGESDSIFSQDINFDGDTTELHASSNDWDNLHLNQVGSRRNVGGWFYIEDPARGDLVAFMGPLSLDTGRGDLGRGDLGRETWAGATSAEATWAEATWAAATWAAATSAEATWAEATWAEAIWAGATWAGETWAGETSGSAQTMGYSSSTKTLPESWQTVPRMN